MKVLSDMFPILLFFIAYKIYGIYVATGVAIGASTLQVSLFWLKHKTIENSQCLTLIVILIFGGLTIFLQDEMFIKLKPTIVNWVFAIVFLGSHFIGNKTIIERVTANKIELPGHAWNKLNVSWTLFFAGLGLLNLFVAFNYDTDTWINYKLFGVLGLTLAFIIGQSLYLSRHINFQK